MIGGFWIIFGATAPKDSFFFFKELGGYLNAIKGLIHPFTYVVRFYFPSLSLWEKASSKIPIRL